MSSYDAIWVKVNNPETDLPFLQEKYNKNTKLTEGLTFACVIKNASDGETPNECMADLSQRFGEAIFMTVQTTVDFFIYSHWHEGELVREIQYCADEGWYQLNGEKEDWEQCLFHEDEKLRQLSYLDLDYLLKKPDSTEYANAQRLAAQIESVWARQELVQESFYPMATANELYHIVMQKLGLAHL